MPLRPIQRDIAQLLASQRSPDFHLAGGAGLHRQEKSIRYSNDLDYFGDREELIGSAFTKDQLVLIAADYQVSIEINQPGYIRAIVSRAGSHTKIEWAYDSAFRFMPAVKDQNVGYVLHPIDLAINKVHALAGRDEPRDFIDVLHLDKNLLSLGALCWAAVGKDPGYSPLGLIEQLARKGRFRPEDFADLELLESPNLIAMKQHWNRALEKAKLLINALPAEDAGCLYIDPKTNALVEPSPTPSGFIRHFGSLGGTLPSILDQ